MLSFLLAIHFIMTITIIGLILLQKHDSDGALGSSGGGAASGMFSVRGQANLLTRATAILMTVFILNCLILAKMVKRMPAKESIIDSVARENIAPRNSVADVAGKSAVASKKTVATPVSKGNAPQTPPKTPVQNKSQSKKK